MEYEVVWAGRKQDGYLCIPPIEIRDFSHLQPMILHDEKGPRRLYRARVDRGRMRQQIRAVLRMRGTMTVKALRKAVGDKDPQFYNVLTRMVKHGVLERPQEGIVRLALHADNQRVGA